MNPTSVHIPVELRELAAAAVAPKALSLPEPSPAAPATSAPDGLPAPKIVKIVELAAASSAPTRLPSTPTSGHAPAPSQPPRSAARPGSSPAVRSPAAQPASPARETLRGPGLRLTFLLSGAQLMLLRRCEAGEVLAEDEVEFLEAIDAQFAALRAALVDHAIHDAMAMLEASRFASHIKVTADREPHDVETIVLLFLRNYLRLALRVLAEEGPDAALAMFDPAGEARDPLAILTCVHEGLASLAENQVKVAGAAKPLIAALVNELRRRVLRG